MLVDPHSLEGKGYAVLRSEYDTILVRKIHWEAVWSGFFDDLEIDLVGVLVRRPNHEDGAIYVPRVIRAIEMGYFF